jgi:PhzF family phenazine biosynthesis protein
MSLQRLAAFTTSPLGGNPAGVLIADALPSPAEMQRIAAEVGYSETAFVAPSAGIRRTVRYYSPLAEVSFCGHATIAAGVAMGELTGAGTYVLETSIGVVPVAVSQREGAWEAALTSVPPSHEPASAALVAEALRALRWSADDLDAGIPAVRAYAGAWHLVLAVRSERTLASLRYEFDALAAIMARDGLTTLQLVWRESPLVFHARNPFPPGGIVEDPATGAAAAALGGYLRDAGLLAAPASMVIHQGAAMGRPSVLYVDVPAAGGIVVRGAAVHI